MHRRIVAEQGHADARKRIQGVLIYSYGSMTRTPRRGDDGLGYILVGLGPRTDAVWLAGNAIGLGLTLAAAFVFPGHGLIFAYLAVTVRLALKRMPVCEILKLDRGSVLKFDKPVEAPLELMVNQKVLGVGEAVQIGNSLGLRITRIDGARGKLDALSA